MENTVKISFSAVTHIGTSCTVNDDRIYANGSFLHPSPADYAQFSLEVNTGKCLFALADGMEDEDSGISLINDLKKFHQKVIGSSKDINFKLDEMVQCVEQSSNLLHSISLGDNDFKEKRTAFAGIIIDEGSIAAANLGSSRIYKLEGDNFKLMVNDFKRAERLLKMGIISDEQAELLSGQQKALVEEGRSTVKKSAIDTLREGATYLICSRGLSNSVNEDAIFDILASYSQPDEAVSKLVEEAIRNDSEDNVTAIVVRVERAGETQAQLPGINRTEQSRYTRSGKSPSRVGRAASAHKKKVDLGSIIPAAVLVILVAVVLLGAFKLWTEIRNPDGKDASSQNETTGTVNNDNSTSPSGISEGDDTTGQPDEDEDDTVTGGAIETGDNTAESGEDADPAVTEGTTYVVKSGDMLMTISKKFYGDENKYKLIMDANKITDPNKIAVGDVLKIPPLE